MTLKRIIWWVLFLLLSFESFSAFACNCGYSLEHFYEKSKSVHLIKVTNLKLIKASETNNVKVDFDLTETLSANKSIPKNILLKPGGCTPSLMPGFTYVIFIPKNKSTETFINKCTGIIELGLLEHPAAQEQVKAIKEEIIELDRKFSG
ncbi:hypothetical protein [Pseudoalteromonas gelatinilytica]|uniref:hypothetical protein n=1 Tax=Pseudoalteromonas gelatinilytica TaxID=1703256 RepID=UPI0007C43C59|nr:hypothetical protein [Pseudoalteromonas gelatinilytica]